MNYTKGEWKVERVDEDNAWIGFDDPESSIEIYTPYHNALANANLIAAAPKLYERLKELVLRVRKDAEQYAPEGNEPIWAYIADAHDTLIEAEGREQ